LLTLCAGHAILLHHDRLLRRRGLSAAIQMSVINHLYLAAMDTACHPPQIHNRMPFPVDIDGPGMPNHPCLYQQN
jgi:hypothetical protein